MEIPVRRMTRTAALSPRRLNRALLARQLLLRRRRLLPLAAIEHLVGIQAQSPRAAYTGLWTRLADFRADQLERLLEDRAAVRAALMRSTIHLVSAADCLELRALVQPAVSRSSRHQSARRAAGVPDEELAQAGRALVDEEPRTFRELGRLLAARWPECDPDALAMGVRELVLLVQVPPRGLWSRGGEARHAAAETWLGRPALPPSADGLRRLVRRYLAAYGPASVADIQAFTGLTRLRDAVDALRTELVSFRDDAGRELLDVPGAPLPGPRTRAPARFLPEFDNVLLSHADRRRILPDGTLSMLSLGNGLSPAFLVDGYVAGSWRLERATRSVTLRVSAFEPLPAAARRELEAEGERLLRFAAPDADRRAVAFAVS
jgi:hypothetical protein